MREFGRPELIPTSVAMRDPVTVGLGIGALLNLGALSTGAAFAIGAVALGGLSVAASLTFSLTPEGT